MGLDEINLQVLREAAEEEVPTDCKRGIIISFLKEKELESYRPLSLTSVPGKVMEQILLESMLRQMENKEGIDDLQHGFTKCKWWLANLMVFTQIAKAWI